jgi:DNA primase
VKAVDEARPFLEFRLDRLLASSDTSSIEGRARTAQLAMTMISEHPNEIVRGEYVSRTAVRVGLDPGQLVEIASRAPAKAASSSPPSRATNPGARINPREIAGLRVAIHAPALVATRLNAGLFIDPVVAAAYGALSSASSFHEALDQATDDGRALLERLAVE